MEGGEASTAGGGTAGAAAATPLASPSISSSVVRVRPSSEPVLVAAVCDDCTAVDMARDAVKEVRVNVRTSVDVYVAACSATIALVSGPDAVVWLGRDAGAGAGAGADDGADTASSGPAMAERIWPMEHLNGEQRGTGSSCCPTSWHPRSPASYLLRTTVIHTASRLKSLHRPVGNQPLPANVILKRASVYV